MDTVFKVFNVLVMVFGGILLLIAVLMIAGVGLLSSGTDAVTQGGFTFFTMLAVLPLLISGGLSFMAGWAGSHSDPDKCKRCSRIIVILLVVSAGSSLRSGSFGFMNLVELAFYGFYCYLAYTQYY